jgi:hypothetical protein
MLNPLIWEYSELIIFWGKVPYHNGIRAFSLSTQKKNLLFVLFFS